MANDKSELSEKLMASKAQLNNAPRHISARDVFNTLFRHKWKIIFFFFSVVSSVTLSALKTTEMYYSEAKMLVRVGRENISQDPSVVGPTQYIEQSLENAINSEISMINSHFLLQKVVNHIGIDNFFSKTYTPKKHLSEEEQLLLETQYEIEKAKADKAKITEKNSKTKAEESSQKTAETVMQSLEAEKRREKAINSISRRLTIGLEVKSNMISLNLRMINAKLAQQTLATLMQFALERHVEIYRSQVSLNFLQEQTDILLAELFSHERRLRQFKKLNRITELTDQLRSIRQQRNEISNDLDSMLSGIEGDAAKIKVLEKSLKKYPKKIVKERTSGSTNYVYVELKRLRIELEQKEADLSERYTDEARALQNVRKQLKVVKQRLDQESSAGDDLVTIADNDYWRSIDADLMRIQAEFRAKIAKKKVLSRLLIEKNARLLALGQAEVELVRLERNVKNAAREYQSYRENLQRARLSDALDRNRASNIRIVQPATLPLRPIDSKRRVKVMMSIILGLLGGIGLAFALEILDDTLKSDEDVKRRLQLPVLASISENEYQKYR